MLNLLGIVLRPTKDCDILYPTLPEAIGAAARAFAVAMRREGDALEDGLGREDLLRTKLFALCDRGLDLADCLARGAFASFMARLATVFTPLLY